MTIAVGFEPTAFGFPIRNTPPPFLPDLRLQVRFHTGLSKDSYQRIFDWKKQDMLLIGGGRTIR